MVQLPVAQEKTMAGQQQPTTTTALKSPIFVLAEKSEQVQLEQLKQFYAERGAPVSPGSASTAFNALNEMLSVGGARFMTICGNEREAEIILNAFFSLIGVFPIGEARQLIESFGKLVSADGAFHGHGWSSYAGVAVKALSNLFNFYGNHAELQSLAYKYLLGMAGRARLTAFLDVAPAKVEANFTKWRLPMDNRRQLLRLLHSALLADKRHREAADVVTTLLRTYTDSDADAAREDAKECVRTAVVDPQSFSLDHLARLSAVRRLEQTDPAVWRVLDIFTNSGWREYSKFVAENPDFVRSQLKVADERALEKKIKMLTLISMAEQSQTLSMTQLSEALGITDEDELEGFIVDAIRLKAIGGKIDGVKRQLTVNSFHYRNFERPQWETLRDRMHTLLTNMRHAHNQIAVTNHSDEV